MILVWRGTRVMHRKWPPELIEIFLRRAIASRRALLDWACTRPEVDPQRLSAFGISMGGLYLGWFTPTEAGGAGAGLAIVYAVLTRRMTVKGFLGALSRTIRTTSFIFLLVIAGKIFGFFLSVSRIPIELGEFVTGLDVTPWVVMTSIRAPRMK